MNLGEIATIAPVLCVTATAVAILALDLGFQSERVRSKLDWVAYAGVAFAFFFILSDRGESPVVGFGSVVADDFSRFLSTAILSATVLAIMQAPGYVAARGVYRAEYYALALLACVGMILLVQAAELITMFLSIELLSLAIYVLCGITRRDPRANEAAVKYFVQGAFATGFLLYGMAMLYGASGSLQFDAIAQQFKSGLSSQPLAIAGLVLLVAGFAFKLGAAPFHVWVPDAYEGAPTVVTSFMSVAVKTAAFGGLVRFLVMAPFANPVWHAVLWAVAVATMVAGNFAAVAQRSVKRMLAYSSVAHTGYALIGLVAAGGTPIDQVLAASLGTSEDPRVAQAGSTILYVFMYTFMTLGAFAFVAWMGKPPSPAHPHGRDAEELSDFAGLAKRRPWAAAMMTIFMISLAGIPPTAGFFGKFALFKAAIQGGHIWLALIGILTSVVSLYYYLRVVVYMYMKDPEETAEAPMEGATDFNLGMVVAISAILTLVLGLLPGHFFADAQHAIEALAR